jgi:hypothetical protein
MEHPGVPCAREVESCPVAISGLPSEPNGLCLVLARLTTLFSLVLVSRAITRFREHL